jgi:hypothetical protein
MAFGAYAGPKEAAAQDAMAFMSACVAKEMPDDWPGQAAEHDRAATHYEAAKRLDPNVPDPNLLTKGLGH